MKRIILFFLIYISFFNVNAQDWSIWKTIYNSNGLKVELSFKFYDCDSSQIQSKFKYQITGNLFSDVKFLNWKMDYINCDNELITQQNSLNIGSEADDGVVESMDDRFICQTMQKNFYDVKIANSAKASKKVTQIIPSEDPQSISGNTSIYRGASTTLEVKGGRLGTNAIWTWYKDGCGSQNIGTGDIIIVSPTETTTYFVKAVSLKDQTKCAQITISVNQNSTPATKIVGNENVCKNGSTELSVVGGSLGLDADWVWYENSCDGLSIGKGLSINVSPQKPTTYYVRAEGKLNKTACVSFSTRIINSSIAPTSISITGSNTICEGENITLKVEGGSLADDAKWFWYKNTCSYGIIGNGNTISVSPNNTTTYFVRAEGKCNVTNCVSTIVNVNNSPISADGIIYPTEIYYNKKIKLEVDAKNTYKSLFKWQWYKTKCEDGKKIGTGTSIVIKPKKETTYFLRSSNDCGNSECVELNVIPTKLHKFHPIYTVDGFEKKFLQIGIGVGLEGGYFSTLAQQSVQSGSGTISTEESTNISFTGLKTEFVFHPYIKDFFGIGILSSFSIGSTPFLFTGGKKNGGYEKEKYLYTKFELGSELTFGFKPVKLLFIYKSNIQTHKYNNTSQGSSITKLVFNRQIRKEYIMAGFRFGAYKKKKSERSICYDLTYNLTRDYAWNWQKFDWNYKAISNWQHGIGFGMWVHSMLKFQIDAAIDSRLGSFSPSKYDNLYLGISFMYNRNAFY